MEVISKYPKIVEYCKTCTFPLEYCEYGCNNVKNNKNKDLKNELKVNKFSVDKSIKIEILITNKKYKVVTKILNLEKYNLDLKNINKAIRKKMGCGSSVEKNEIEIQGNQSEMLINFLISEYKDYFTKDSFILNDKQKKKNKK